MLFNRPWSFGNWDTSEWSYVPGGLSKGWPYKAGTTVDVSPTVHVSLIANLFVK